jgi:peptidoglycan hydrolase-like protein with peptidoglycan-binding domain
MALTGCDAIYGFLDKKGAEEKELLGVVIPYERNEKVEDVQTLLKLYGYPIGNPDGVLGPQTRTAIKRFQEDVGLEPSRYIDQLTWTKLNYFRYIGLVKNKDLNIKKIQEILLKEGYDVGQPDGTIGDKTTQALKKFQKKENLKSDGKIGLRTLSRLARRIPLPSKYKIVE